MPGFDVDDITISETIDVLTAARISRSQKLGLPGPDHGKSIPRIALLIIGSIEAGPSDGAMARANYHFALSALDSAYLHSEAERPPGLSREAIRAEISRAWALPITPRPQRPYVPTYDERCGYTSAREWTGDYSCDRRGLA